MKALLKPRQNRPQDQDEVVELVARTGNGRVTIQLRGRSTFAVDTFRLYSLADRRQRLAATDLAQLPWNGKGTDPLKPSSLRAPARGEVSASYADGGVGSPSRAAHDPSVGDYADTSPASLGRNA